MAMEIGDWTKPDVIIGSVGAILLFIVLVFNYFALRSANRSANEAKRANNRADEEMVTRLQPSLAIHQPQPVANGLINIPVTNHGEWPASEIDIFVAWDKNLDAALESIKNRPLRKRNAIYGGETFQQTVLVSNEEWTDSLVNGDYPIFIVGRVTYHDPQTGRNWCVEASYQLQKASLQPVKVGIPELITETAQDSP